MNKSISERQNDMEKAGDKYAWAHWPEPENKKELAAIEFVRKKYPKTASLGVCAVADLLLEWDEFNE